MGKTAGSPDRNLGYHRPTTQCKPGLLILSVLLISLSLIRCTGAGIYSTIAISTKIDEGTLPKGLSAGPVFHVSGAGEYLFFVSGPNIWVKPMSGGEWTAMGLNAGGMEWDGVQSAVATENRIILALYFVSGNTFKVGLFALTSFDGSRAVYDDFDKSWISKSKSFQTVRLFCPRPAGDIYVNVLNHSGSYGSLDSDGSGFSGSRLYRLANNSTAWRDTTVNQPELDGTKGARYVSGVADNGAGTILVTATARASSADGGYLLDENGVARGDDGKIDGSYISTTGITWIRRGWEKSNKGVFITAATSLVSGVHPILVSEDGTTWHRLSGATGGYQTTNFIDVSNKKAGMSDSKHLILAGTSSYIDGNRYRRGVGYNEIDVTSDDLTEWAVNSNRSSYSLANLVNFSVSKLSESTVVGMSIPKQGNALYVSTRNNGIWRIDLSEDRPFWTRE